MEKVRNIRLAAPVRRCCDVSLLNMAHSWTQFSTFCLSAGELTLEEFISGAREHPDIMEMLTKMMDLTHVLEIIVSGQQKKAINWAADKFGRGGGRGEGFGHNGWRAGSRLTLPHQELYCTWLRAPVHDWLLPQRKQRNHALLSAWAPTVLGTFINASLSSGERQQSGWPHQLPAGDGWPKARNPLIVFQWKFVTWKYCVRLWSHRSGKTVTVLFFFNLRFLNL